jgi:hypothetical protein
LCDYYKQCSKDLVAAAIEEREQRRQQQQWEGLAGAYAASGQQPGGSTEPSLPFREHQ